MICKNSECKKEFINKFYQKKYCCPKCCSIDYEKKRSKRPERIIYQRKLNQTPKRKAYNKKWFQSPSGKSSVKKHAQSPKGRATMKKYDKSPKGKARHKKYFLKYPERRKAKEFANKHIKIPEDQMCERCKYNLATEKHHENYDESKWGEIVFCCAVCHPILDKERREREAKLRKSL